MRQFLSSSLFLLLGFKAENSVFVLFDLMMFLVVRRFGLELQLTLALYFVVFQFLAKIFLVWFLEIV